ncbi:MAG: hypothetical protein A2355_07280, partial [Spirochaetes bacterium RIFOXYB1_FULL_32_8]
MKRILFFTHYNPVHLLSDYVVFTLQCMRSYYEKIVVISNSTLSQNDYETLGTLADDVFVRKNIGFDFSAWQEAILKKGFDALLYYDTLTIMNDTCFGPIFELDTLFQRMESDNTIDFWGITNNKKSKNGMPETGGAIPEHIQSYFMSFKKNVVSSDVFIKFWKKIQPFTNVSEIIQKYETQLTVLLEQTGFRSGTMLDANMYNLKETNVSNHYPEILIDNNVPFIKIKSFLLHSNPKYLKDYIQNKTSYSVELIESHFNSILPPDINLLYSNKLHIVSENKPLSAISQKIAIHIHAFYIEEFQELITVILRVNFTFDLYITTDSQLKKDLIEKVMIITNLHFEIILVENRGRDIFPWLHISSKLNEYDIVGHFHTKRSPTGDSWIGKSWMNEIKESLINSSTDILNIFATCSSVGVIIPDIPFYFSSVHLISGWGNNQKICQSLWDSMGLPKNISFKNSEIPVMPYGFSFWYKPVALLPLFNLHLKVFDFPEEPLANESTVPHAIERLPVYIAWAQGFDFRVVKANKYVQTGFEVKKNWYIHQKNPLFKKIVAKLFPYGSKRGQLLRRL